MEKVSLVLFDMDGLLINTEREMWLVNEAKTIESMGFQYDENYFISYIGSSVTNYRNAVMNKYGKDFDFVTFYKKLNEFNDLMIKNHEIHLMKGARELLDYLKENNIDMKVATSTPHNQATKILDSLNLLNYFKEVVSGEDVKNGKPAPDIYLKAVNDYSKDETLIFEDSHNGARAAIASGIRLMLVPDLAHVTLEDKSQAYHVLNDLSEGIKYISEINK